MLKRLFSLSRLSTSWRRRQTPKPSTIPPTLIPPEEFARLICSGRVEDLRLLAKKLSGRKAHA
ncbi:MAG: hypothetical protein JOZ74_11445 [Bradyrhizobium sp.]|nr:hypothetical protein [Bradyrhizobium sp.]